MKCGEKLCHKGGEFGCARGADHFGYHNAAVSYLQGR
jgi:hypothetical protein